MSDALLNALKACKPPPSKVRLVQGDETLGTDIVVQHDKKKRWDAVLQIAEQYMWSHALLLDKSGNTLRMVANDDPAGELEDLGAGAGADVQAMKVERMVSIMLRAQERALHFRDAETRAAMQAMVQVMRQTTEAVSTMSRIYQSTLNLVMQGAEQAARSAAAADDGMESDGMMKAIAPIVVQRMLGVPPPPPPPPPSGVNGAKKQ
jgi:hypothetical protein